jgi:hypothetical protein
VVRHHGAPWQFPKLFYFSAALLWSTEDGVVADAAALLASVVAHERFGEAAASIASIDGLQLRDAATTALVDRIAAALARPRVRCVASTLVLELLAARGLWHSPEMAPALLLLFVPLLCGNLLPAPAVEQRRAVSENLVTAAAMDAAVLKRLWRVGRGRHCARSVPRQGRAAAHVAVAAATMVCGAPRAVRGGRPACLWASARRVCAAAFQGGSGRAGHWPRLVRHPRSAVRRRVLVCRGLTTRCFWRGTRTPR